MTCTIITNSTNNIEKVLTPEGVESSLYKQIASMPFIQSADEAIGVYVRSSSPEVQNEINSLEGVEFDKISGEPKLSYRLADGSVENNYKDALSKSNGGEIHLGVRAENGFVPIQSIQTSVSPNTVQGAINNHILNGLISPVKTQTSNYGGFGLTSDNPMTQRHAAENLLRDLQKVSNNFEIKDNAVVPIKSNEITDINQTINSDYLTVKYSKKPQVSEVVQEIPNSELSPLVERLQESGLANQVIILDSADIDRVLNSFNKSTRNSVQNVGIKGFVVNNDVYLNSDNFTLDTPIHEFAHLWNNMVKNTNPTLYKQGLKLVETEGQHYVDLVQRSQPNLQGEALLEEALAQAIGDNGAKLLQENSKGLLNWLEGLWSWINEKLGITDLVDRGDLPSLTLEQFSTAVAIDLLKKNHSPAAELVTTKTYGDAKTKISVGFFEESKLPEYIKDGRVKVHKDLNFLDNTDVFFAGPDDTFVGEATFDFGNGDVKSVQGDGGLFFPLSFEDIWAFKNNGNNTSLTVMNHINYLYERNKEKGIDKTYVALVKGADSKGISNPQGIEVAFRVLEGMINSNILMGDEIHDNLETAVEEAKILQAKTSLSKKNKRLKAQGKPVETDYTSLIPNFNLDVNRELTLEETKNNVIEFFRNDESLPFTFRKHFMDSLLGGIWRGVSKDKGKVSQIKDFLGFAKGDKLSLKQEFIDGIIRVSSEGRVTQYNSGDVYAAIEVSGPVIARLEGVDGEKVHPVFNGRIIQVDETGEKVPVKMHLIDGHFKYNEFATTLDGKSILDAKTKLEAQSISGKVFGVSQSWGLGTIVSQGLDMSQIKYSKEVPEDYKDTLENFKDYLDNGSWGMMTGANPMGQKYTDIQNSRALRRAVDFLKDLGYQVDYIDGKYGHTEESLFVPGITREDALKFAKAFNQDSVLTEEGMIFQDNSIYPRDKSQDTFNGDYSDFYSTIKIDGQNVDFQIGLDMSEKIAPEEVKTEQSKEGEIYNQPIHAVSGRTRRHLTEDGEGNFVFYHYSKVIFDTLDPRKSGTNGAVTSTDETGAWSLAGGVSYLYTETGQSESLIGGNNGYQFKIPMTEVYDADLDINNYKSQLVEDYIKNNPVGAHPSGNQLLALVTKKATDSGYKLTTAKWSGYGVRAQTNLPLQPTDMRELDGNRIVKDFNNNYETNFQKVIANEDIYSFDNVDEFFTFIARKFSKDRNVTQYLHSRLDLALGFALSSTELTPIYKKLALDYARELNEVGVIRRVPQELKDTLDALVLPTISENPSIGSNINDNIIDKLNNDDSIDKLEC